MSHFNRRHVSFGTDTSISGEGNPSDVAGNPSGGGGGVGGGGGDGGGGGVVAGNPSGGASDNRNNNTNVESVKQSYNPLIKIFWFSIFCAVLLKPIYNIFLFFGFDLITILLYMGWFIFLLLILMFIPQQYSNINL